MNNWLIRTNDFQSSPVPSGIVTTSTRPQALRLGLKKLAFFWGIGLLCIFIPVFHFVLVPLFVILGLIFFFKSLRIQHWAENIHVPCPACRKDLELKSLGFEEELRFKCSSCGVPLVLTQDV